MKKNYFLSLLIFSLLFSFANFKAQTPINRKVFSINAWFINNADPNPAANLTGKWKEIAASGVTHVRLGGIDANWLPLYSWSSPSFTVEPFLGHVDKLRALIDSCRAYNMEPIIEVGFAPPHTPNTCTTTPLYGVSISDAAKIAGNVVNAINNTIYTNTVQGTPTSKILNWIIANEPDHSIKCPPTDASFGGFNWDNDSLGHADSIANYIRIFSTAMKNKDPDIKIIGPEMAGFSPWTGYSQSKMLKAMVTTSLSANLTGTIQTGAGTRFILDEVTFHHYPTVRTRDLIINEPTDNFEGLRGKLTSNNTSTQRSGMVTYINNGLSGRTSSNLSVGVTEYNLANPNDIDENTDFSGMIKGRDFRSFLGGQWLSLTLAEAMSNPFSGHYCLWSVIENGIFTGDPCKDGFGYISNCSGKKRPSYHHMAMTSKLAGNFYYGSAVTNTANVKTFAGVETGAGFHIMVLNMDSTTTYNTTKISFSGGASGSALNINYSFAGSLSTPSVSSYTDNTPIQAKSTILYEFDCHGAFVKRVDYTEAMAVAGTEPALKAVGGVNVNPNISTNKTISGIITTNTVFTSDTLLLTGDVIIAANTKVTFLNSLVLVEPGKKIMATPQSTLEIKNSVFAGKNNATWKGITATSNYLNGVGLLIDKSAILNADNGISTDKMSEMKITQSIIASTGGQRAIFMDRGQKEFTVNDNLIVGYTEGISTARSQSALASKITNNQFVDVKRIWNMVNDNFTNAEFTCNRMKGFTDGIVSKNSSVNDFGSSTMSAGNVFVQSGVQQDYLKLSSANTKYYFGPSQNSQFISPNISNIPLIQSSLDRMCSQIATDCQPLQFPLVGIKENSVTMAEVLIYPNPSSGIFNLSAANLSGNYTLNIHDVLGRLINTQKLNLSTDKNVTFEILSKGLYIVTLENKESRITQKIIVE